MLFIDISSQHAGVAVLVVAFVESMKTKERENFLQKCIKYPHFVLLAFYLS